MFLNELTESEKKSYWILANQVASAHEGVSMVEQDVLNRVLTELDIEPSNYFTTVESACAVFLSEKSKRIAIVELSIIALIDHDYDIQERKLIRLIAENFGLGLEFLDRAERWAESIVGLYSSGRTMISAKF